jgi:hypothetical protein
VGGLNKNLESKLHMEGIKFLVQLIKLLVQLIKSLVQPVLLLVCKYCLHSGSFICKTNNNQCVQT